MLLMKLKLPHLLTPEKKIYVPGLVSVSGAGLYLFFNRFNLYQPQELPLLWPDREIPLWAESVWIYISIYFMYGITYYLAKDLVNLSKYLYASLFQVLFSVSIFMVWPTTYPRHLYPLPDGIGGGTEFIFSLIRNIDTPASCCPSLHVSTAFLTSFVFLKEQKSKFPLFFIWAVIISLSTLSTKQHYFWDVIGGVMVAVLSYVLFFQYFSYE
jgi:membrane-associated phospholipid phosphatase